ncbi:MAG: Trk system potassium transporter TrkA [Oscillospiraceae bacterium]|nr:Trk system potassium transporter TrkA [Oscillospiraceae bacterium]
MKIVIVGCGKIGVALIDALLREGHTVLAVDNRPELLDKLLNQYDVMCLPANGVDYDMLNEPRVKSSDLLIAVTGSDELNMLICYLAKRQGVQHTIARIRNTQYNETALDFLRPELDLSMPLNPEQLAAQEIHNILKLPAASKVETFSLDSFEMVELRIKEDSPLVGHPLTELRERFRAKFLICVVQRGNEVVIPRGNFVLQSGDRIGITADRSELWKLLKQTGLARRQSKKIMLVGGSRIAYYLSKRLQSSGSKVVLIEVDKTRSEQLHGTLPNAQVFHADGTDQERLLEFGLLNQDAFVSLTGMDEENLLLAYNAKIQQVGQVIAKINRDEIVQMAEQMGLENVISPKNVVVNVVLRYVRALENSMDSSIEKLYQLMDGKAEALEFVVPAPAPFTNIQLKNLHLKKNILIAGLLRNNSAIIPDGEDMILPGDRVVVISGQRKLKAMMDILQ